MNKRQNDPLQLHPEFRARQSAMLLELSAMGIPFGWAWPKLLRTKLRDARRWEADKAYKVLMSDMCWEIWLKNAEIEPGPEVHG